MKTMRQRIAALAGFGVSILSFFVFFILMFSIQRTILWTLLCVFYVSIITFLVLWNIIKTKKVYLLLSIPAMCIAAGIAIVEYYNYVQKIPTVNDQDIYVYRYIPFSGDNSLARLDEKSNFNITDNLPVLDGATALFPVYASFVQAVYPEMYSTYEVIIFCNKTDRAYENLLDGKADIIFCAGPSDSQMRRFDNDGLKLKLVPIGREAFVFFVNKENQVNNVSIEDIRGIYSGKIVNWRELNGNRQNIRVFQRPKGSGSQTMLEKVMRNDFIINPRRENVSWGMGDIISQVAVYRNFPDAIGYSFLYFSTEMVKNDQIKLLSIGGIYPSRRTIQDNSYPFSDSFYAIYVDSDDKNENIEPFIDWILSEQGQTLISKTGYIPIRME
jgi:phosphate transport system substrate-binding protein